MSQILHFSHSAPPKSGGTSTRHYFLAKYSLFHHEIVVNGESNVRQEILDNLAVNFSEENGSIAWWNKIPVLRGWIKSKQFKNKLKNQVRAITPQIIQGHNPEIYAEAGLEFKHESASPLFIFDIHQLVLDKFREKSKSSGIQERFRNWVIKRRFNKLLSQSDHIIVQTSNQEKAISNYMKGLEGKITVIPMGVDPQMFNPEIVPSVEINRMFSSDRISFLINGSFSQRTGGDFVIEALPILAKNFTDIIEFILIGNTETYKSQLQSIQNNIGSFVKLYDSVDLSEMPQIYKAADVVFMPYPNIISLKNNEPTKLLEAMAMEKVILSSKVEGVNKLLQDGGLYFDYGDIESLVSQIDHIVKNLNQLKIGARGNRSIIINHRSWQKISQKQDRLYHRLVN